MSEFLLTLFAPLAGGLLYGFERIVRARMQNRQGPPLLQPFYDMFKLLDKVPSIIHPAHALLAIVHFVSLWAVVGMLIYGGHLLYIIFLHLFSSILLVVAGFSVRSIYSHIGANRELMSIIAYEPILILVACGFYLLNGSFHTSHIRADEAHLVMLLPLFVAFIFASLIKLKKSPFDAAEAHQEIVGGVEIEYGGIYYEFLYMAKWLENIFIYLFAALFAGENLLLAFGIVASLFLLLNLIDNTTARVRVDHLLRITLAIALSLGVLNLFGVAYAL